VKHAEPGNRALGFSPGRRLQLMMDTRNDPYRARRKPRGELLCPDCAIICREGRWQHGPADAQAHAHRCPACQRIADRYPAGTLTIEGSYAYEHRSEVLVTARHVAEQMQVEHPLQRIMDIEALDGRIQITTTDIHLVQAIGKSLLHAYGGVLRYGFAEGQYQLRVDWAA
jgi:hypothetical protein